MSVGLLASTCQYACTLAALLLAKLCGQMSTGSPQCLSVSYPVLLPQLVL